MFTVSSSPRGKKKSKSSHSSSSSDLRPPHEVKALEVIWRKFPEYWSASNTLHIDDLSRNFAFNPKNGIKVSAYKRENRQKDGELYFLSFYLKLVADEKDVTKLRHKDWRERVSEEAKKSNNSLSSTTTLIFRNDSQQPPPPPPPSNPSP
ncbi:had family iiid protein [Cystoisospora suis]|uniref:Had family iiid protein n=1 Tax=Cystoisospora suis TaxID=483139 RepID=A0A2C6KAF4_9APIC|nr:had family iiid protein [Cystoisospora suis]